MKRIVLLVLMGALLTAAASAQVSGFNQRGRATQEMRNSGLAIAHPSLPLNLNATVINTSTGKQIEAKVSGRIQPSAARIADLSEGVWQALELDADTEIIISVGLQAWDRAVQPTAVVAVEPPPAESAAEEEQTAEEPQAEETQIAETETEDEPEAVETLASAEAVPVESAAVQPAPVTAPPQAAAPAQAVQTVPVAPPPQATAPAPVAQAPIAQPRVTAPAPVVQPAPAPAVVPVAPPPQATAPVPAPQTPPAATPPVAQTPALQASAPAADNGMRIIFIMQTVIGIILVLLALAFLLFWLSRDKRRSSVITEANKVIEYHDKMLRSLNEMAFINLMFLSHNGGVFNNGLSAGLRPITDAVTLDTTGRREKMLRALNEMAFILLSHNDNEFDNILSASLKPVADAVSLDRIVIYKYVHTAIDRYIVQSYCWEKKEEGFIPIDERMKMLPDIPVTENWVSSLEKGMDIHINTETTSVDEKLFLNIFGIKSILMTPVFIKDELWGSITYQDHTNERLFDEVSIDMMHSAANLLVNAIMREQLYIDALPENA